MIPYPGVDEAHRLTGEALSDPRPGDRFHEMYSFWVYVLEVDATDRVVTLVAHPPCSVPTDGRIEVYDNAADYLAAFTYDTIPGKYWVQLAERGNDVEGWRAAATRWPDVDASARRRERRAQWAAACEQSKLR